MRDEWDDRWQAENKLWEWKILGLSNLVRFRSDPRHEIQTPSYGSIPPGGSKIYGLVSMRPILA